MHVRAGQRERAREREIKRSNERSRKKKDAILPPPPSLRRLFYFLFFFFRLFWERARPSPPDRRRGEAKFSNYTAPRLISSSKRSWRETLLLAPTNSLLVVVVVFFFDFITQLFSTEREGRLFFHPPKISLTRREKLCVATPERLQYKTAPMI